MANEPRTSDLNLDLAGMFLEETFTDRRVGTLRRLTPVKSDGSPDPARAVIYVGETQVMIQPLNMPAIVAQAQEQLTGLIQDYGAEIILPATWPAATGRWPRSLWRSTPCSRPLAL